jgi:hypothetical protein
MVITLLYVMGVQPFYDFRVTYVVMDCFEAACVKIKIRGILNYLNYCVIVVIHK